MNEINKYIIDHEEFKIKIRISTSVNLLIQQDMFKFGYLKKNHSLNPNLFLNHLLPIMDEYRNEKNSKLISKLQKSNSMSYISEELINKINNILYEDYFDNCNEIINLRISKENMKIFENEKKRTSTYIKSLINEYSSIRLDYREFLFFNKEYNYIQNSIDKKTIISFNHNNNKITFLPIYIVKCPIDSSLYIFGLYKKETSIFIQSVKLCEIEALHIIDRTIDFLITKNLNERINKYILELEYLENERICIGGN